MSTSIFQGDRVLGNRPMFRKDGVVTGSGDPLASIPSLLDLRTHLGDKQPFGINPATGGANGRWQGITASASQPAGNAQPITKFTADGTPYLDFDGVDDWMSVGVHGGQKTYTVIVRSKTPSWSIWASFLESSGAVNNPDRWGSLLADSNSFHTENAPASVRCNGINLSAPFPIPAPDEWNVITVTTAVSPGAVERGLFQWESRFFLAAEIIAVFIHGGVPDNARIEAAENYFMTLKPQAAPSP